MTEREEIEILTNLFRTSTEWLWRRMREVVCERGVTPSTSMLAVSFEDDENFEFGILVTLDHRVIQYGFRYSVPSGIDGTLTEWNDVTERKASLPHKSQIATALSMLVEVA